MKEKPELTFDTIRRMEDIEYSKVRMNHLPNIYLLGVKGVLDFLEVFRIAAE